MKKTFVVTSKAWYMNVGLNNPTQAIFDKDRIKEQLVLNCSKGKNSYEFFITWYELKSGISPKISFFDDSWLAFDQLPELFKAFASMHGKNPTPETIIQVLKELKFKDVTKTKKPA
jgi:hypothetical protein